MDLETLALIGEFVGGIAVVITIVYLAYQTRQTRLLLAQSNQQQTASMLRANIDGWNEAFSSIMSTNETLSVYKRMRCGTELVGDDLQRAELIAYKLFLNLENLILQNAQTPFVEGVDDILDDVVRHRVLEILRSDRLLLHMAESGVQERNNKKLPDPTLSRDQDCSPEHGAPSHWHFLRFCRDGSRGATAPVAMDCLAY